jgi:hypothetical protein
MRFAYCAPRCYYPLPSLPPTQVGRDPGGPGRVGEEQTERGASVLHGKFRKFYRDDVAAN